MLENPLREMRVMRYLGPHPGLCQLHHILQDEEISDTRCVYMVMDLMRGACHRVLGLKCCVVISAAGQEACVHAHKSCLA